METWWFGYSTATLFVESLALNFRLDSTRDSELVAIFNLTP